MLDPALREALLIALSAMLLAGAWSKARNFPVWVATVAAYALMPERAATGAGLIILALELIAGLLLIVPTAGIAGAVASLTVLAISTVAVVINLMRGRRDIRCGCGGIGAEQRLSWPLVARNCILLAATYATTLTVTARDLLFADHLVALATAVGLAGLYAAANNVMANQPRLKSMRSSG